ncbi:4Fe-4S binding protein [Odoribacter lunatus]|uniref:4Fe-4S binding protein n=1 Tax=Odoribacter lunatus TaxID=2941335 RepID=UPI00203BDCA5|nr:4Fe-4S binding protein [Odoribacter lunatus]
MVLKKIRVAFAAVFFIAVTALFLDFTGTVHAWLGWTAKIQFLPALLALNVGVVVGLVVLTLLLGRVYCSVICPLGVMQDIVSWINGRRKKKKYRFSYSPEKRWLRYGVLGLFVVALVAGIGSFAALLAPYSSYGRIASNLFALLYGWGNNLLAYFAERADSYAFYETEVWLKSLPTFAIAVVTFVALVVLAWRNGRTYCNTICPVGTVLGFLSRFSLLHITIDERKCNGCGLCSRKCKAACIDGKEHRVDYSRCVACMDCIETCKHEAVGFRLRTKNSNGSATGKPAQESGDERIDTARRSFLTTTTLVVATATLKAQEKKVDGGLAVIADKKIPDRSTPIVPPGAQSLRNMAAHCTACQLCVSVCPNGVLRPSTKLETLMQPEASYERGYCRPECTKCSEVCPAGAILKITTADKSAIQIGHAVWIKENCVPLTDGVDCGNCARHCPAGAILMVPSNPDMEDSPRIPVVNTGRCIGCGACENLCPARPFSAIYVEGHERHRII